MKSIWINNETGEMIASELWQLDNGPMCVLVASPIWLKFVNAVHWSFWAYLEETPTTNPLLTATSSSNCE